MNPFGSWIGDRQKALARGDITKFRSLKNHINRERKRCRALYYESKVKHLKERHPAAWWKG